MNVELGGPFALSIADIVPVAPVSEAHAMPGAAPKPRSESTIGS